MRALGIRAAKDHARWAVLERDGEDYTMVAKGNLIAPKTYEEVDSLAWYRERVQTLVRQHKVDEAAVRFAETFLGPKIKPSSTTLASMMKRARLEGVVIEALRAGGIPVGIGGWQQISSRMGTKSAKSYTASGDLRGLDISKETPELQEAILAAASMLGK